MTKTITESNFMISSGFYLYHPLYILTQLFTRVKIWQFALVRDMYGNPFAGKYTSLCS